MALPFSLISEIVTAEDAIVYNTLAASTVVFWEHIITFRQEVDLIWRSNWSLINALFFVIRYTNLGVRIIQLMAYTNISGVIHPSPTLCKAWVWFEAIAGHAIFLAVEIVLVMRVIAFYERKKNFMAWLITTFIVFQTSVLAILLLSIPKFQVIPNPLPPRFHVCVCLVLKAPALFVKYWAFGLVIESILFVLLVIKFIQMNQKKAGQTHLILVFMRDGAWAFGVVFAMMLWAAISFNLTPAKGDIALTWFLAVVPICGVRLVMNLRNAVQEARNTLPNPGMELLSRTRPPVASISLASLHTEQGSRVIIAA